MGVTKTKVHWLEVDSWVGQQALTICSRSGVAMFLA